MTIHEDLAAHLSDFGLNVMGCVPLSNRRSAPNPSELSIRWNARRHTTYRLFAWNITHEGRGRKNDNLRVQATSFGNTNSPIEVDPTVLCVGWSEPHAVYVGKVVYLSRKTARWAIRQHPDRKGLNAYRCPWCSIPTSDTHSGLDRWHIGHRPYSPPPTPQLKADS